MVTITIWFMVLISLDTGRIIHYTSEVFTEEKACRYKVARAFIDDEFERRAYAPNREPLVAACVPIRAKTRPTEEQVKSVLETDPAPVPKIDSAPVPNKKGDSDGTE